MLRTSISRFILIMAAVAPGLHRITPPISNLPRPELLACFYAKRSWAPDYPFAWINEKWQAMLDDIEQNWSSAALVRVLKAF